MTAAFELPWMPPAEIVRVEGRGEFFVRRHVHRDPHAPTVVLLHGWTASADLQFFTAYRALAERVSFIGIDHRGHGRGPRTLNPFDFDEVADDHVAVARQLGIEQAVLVGYSMGGPIALDDRPSPFRFRHGDRGAGHRVGVAGEPARTVAVASAAGAGFDAAVALVSDVRAQRAAAHRHPGS